MALLKKDTPEEAAAKAAHNEHRALTKAWEAFWASPVGKARLAYRSGDHVFQYSIDVLSQQAIIVAMVGSNTSSRSVDPTTVLNAVCREGWELVTGGFPFVMTGQQSRDKFLASGQNIAVAGTVIGYYLFKRCEGNLQMETDEQLRQRLVEQIA
jgi:hypothetical protein